MLRGGWRRSRHCRRTNPFSPINEMMMPSSSAHPQCLSITLLVLLLLKPEALVFFLGRGARRCPPRRQPLSTAAPAAAAHTAPPACFSAPLAPPLFPSSFGAGGAPPCCGGCVALSRARGVARPRPAAACCARDLSLLSSLLPPPRFSSRRHDLNPHTPIKKPLLPSLPSVSFAAGPCAGWQN